MRRLLDGGDSVVDLATAALAVAIGEVGVREVPPGLNRGPEVDRYLASVGLSGGYSWCIAFVHWCFGEAARVHGVANPFPATGGCADGWSRVRAASPARVITAVQARAHPALVRPGCVFVLDLGGGAGHAGFVEHAAGPVLRTVEGNTNAGGSRNGIGVFRLARRTLADRPLRGFLDFTDH
jgi:hypothetical protein